MVTTFYQMSHFKIIYFNNRTKKHKKEGTEFGKNYKKEN